ncbi:hypothetical protein PAXRUDRAFT_29189 [Paxillus rubicundulus Ve08.2h10]|uniref:Uncharacterized protein n=1 Tax=Paxillus rubicundulus Ve08.2h10 TaxID=930991 RepID=A0A0D0BRQ0_9AGAM|nr:hypothetical protein PAXRUDRAFT_29189 [Paxillus rubicundulus Ve08.2h10]
MSGRVCICVHYANFPGGTMTQPSSDQSSTSFSGKPLINLVQTALLMKTDLKEKEKRKLTIPACVIEMIQVCQWIHKGGQACKPAKMHAFLWDSDDASQPIASSSQPSDHCIIDLAGDSDIEEESCEGSCKDLEIEVIG